MTTTLDEMLTRARARLARISPADLAARMAEGALVVDVRDSALRATQGELPGATVIDLTLLEWRLAPSSDYRLPDVAPDRMVILVCSEGYSSSLAAARLQDLGLSHATDLEGGFTAWAALPRQDSAPPA